MCLMSKFVTGSARAVFTASRLIAASLWFEVTPLPDNEYEFKVKSENYWLLKELVVAGHEAISTGHQEQYAMQEARWRNDLEEMTK